MRLRARLAITLLLAAVPAVGGGLLVRRMLVPRPQEQRMQALLEDATARGGPGACAEVVARVADLQGRRARRVLIANAVLGAWMLLCAVAAAGPIVRRIRALGAAVRRSAAARYGEPVPAGGDDELADLARSFNQAGEEVRSHLLALERREQVLRSFVANTTHDVMVPLTVLQGHLVGLRKRTGGEETSAELIVAALEETHYLASLVHNLGAAAKLEAGEPETARHPVNLGPVVERVVGRHRPIARHREIDVDLAVPEEPLHACGDVTLIEQALSNIVHNAVRYNHPGGHVAVVLEAREAGRAFSLRVIDDGPGVPEEQLARLTERHFRGDAARSRRPEGRGLGLHITQEVARRHGFGLRITRGAEGGLEVALSGPLSQQGATPLTPAAEQHASCSPADTARRGEPCGAVAGPPRAPRQS